MKNKANNIFMIVIFFLFISFGMITLVREEKELSFSENRNLNKFKHFTIKNFLNGSYQKNLENAYLDQFIGSERIKKMTKKYLYLDQILFEIKGLCNNNYLSIGNGYYTYDCEKLILGYPYQKKSNTENYFKKIGQKYSELHDKVDFNYYYIPSSTSFDFRKNKMSIDVPKMFKKYWTGNYKFDYLELNSIKDFKKNFYRTDHHWNHKGSYQGYKEIMTMLDENANIIKPIEEIKFSFNFRGSMAKAIRFYNYVQPFTVYKFNIPEHKVYINGNPSKYGSEESYFNGTHNVHIDENHYGSFYGEDYGEVMFDFNQQDKDNILIIGNSYTNAINKLIAANYNKTYVIDLRHYETTFGEKFDLLPYIEKNNINKVLIVMNLGFINSDSFDWWGVEENAV